MFMYYSFKARPWVRALIVLAGFFSLFPLAVPAAGQSTTAAITGTGGTATSSAIGRAAGPSGRAIQDIT